MQKEKTTAEGDLFKNEGIELPSSPQTKQNKKPHYYGHRSRLRNKFLKNNAAHNSIEDYELLEIILFAASPRGDVKPLAKELIKHFRGLDKVISADINTLRNFNGLSDSGIAAIKAVNAAMEHILRKTTQKKPVINSWQALIDYLHISIGKKNIEHFKILFLDKGLKLLADEMQYSGTVDRTSVYPREVIKRALELQASAIILVHNHPAGDPSPSVADMDLTEAIIKAAKPLRIKIYDHIIVADGEYFSFRAHGLIET